MVNICMYFQVHQPYRMKHYRIFDIGKDHEYFDEEKNKEIMLKVARKCYLPTNKVLLDLLNQHDRFKIAFSFSGVALEQFQKYAPEVLDSFRELVDTGKVEILSETYYHSLAFVYSKQEFKQQVEMHKKKIIELFGVSPKVFRNTELIYNNELASYVEELGFKAILAEGADHVLGWRSSNFVYRPVNCNSIKLLLKNYKLSDDIAFRFSNKGWDEWPLTVEKYAGWVNNVNGNGECVNLFMDYETFGEHQWEDTGIFDFLKQMPGELLKHGDNDFLFPSEVAELPVRDTIDVHKLMSWADVERDLSAWVGNRMQKSAVARLYKIERMVKRVKDKQILEDWRKLQTSDHFYYMCTKWFSDGDVHKYFNPYDTPYDSFMTFMNILNDLELRIKSLREKPWKKIETNVTEVRNV